MGIFSLDQLIFRTGNGIGPVGRLRPQFKVWRIKKTEEEKKGGGGGGKHRGVRV